MKKVVIGCAIIGSILFLIAVIVAVRFGPPILQYAKSSFADEKEKRNFVSQWEPPKGNDATRFFPPTVATRQRNKVSEETIEIFHTNQKGVRASYGADSKKVEVLIWNGDDQERQRVCNEMNKEYEKASGGRSWLNFEYRCYYKTQNEQAHLWYLKGWLFLFLSETSEDLNPFIHSYLTAIDGR